MADEIRTELKGYKIFCFDGESKLIEIELSRLSITEGIFILRSGCMWMHPSGISMIEGIRFLTL